MEVHVADAYSSCQLLTQQNPEDMIVSRPFPIFKEFIIYSIQFKYNKKESAFVLQDANVCSCYTSTLGFGSALPSQRVENTVVGLLLLECLANDVEVMRSWLLCWEESEGRDRRGNPVGML